MNENTGAVMRLSESQVQEDGQRSKMSQMSKASGELEALGSKRQNKSRALIRR